MITNIECFYEPIQIMNQLSENRAEMSEGQLSFLCGLIKKHRPKKIVEIGVASGGTTAVILNCIYMLDLDSEVFSIDLSPFYYLDTSKNAGYLAEEYKALLDRKVRHTIYTGKYAVENLDAIGKEVDFLILDTVHSLPGELLDFLGYYPVLKQDGIVVLHDIGLNHYRNDMMGFATNFLFNIVVAEKFLYMKEEVPNIGAFRLTADTERYIGNIFFALATKWNYMPEENELRLYREVYSKWYSEENLQMYDMAVELNRKTLRKMACMREENFLKIYKMAGKMWLKRVYIYGNGNWGRKIFHMLSQVEGITVSGYIVSDGQDKNQKAGEKVYYLSEINLDREKDIVFVGINTVNTSLLDEICSNLKEKGIDDYILPDGIYEYLV